MASQRLLRPSLSQLTRRYASSLDQEVAKFSSMDADWWDPTKNPLIAMNAIRMQYIQSIVGDLHAKTALDIGCGGGLLSESLARRGATVTGVDPSARLLAAAKVHQQLDPRTSAIDYVEGTAEDIQGSFDIVCLLEVVEHVNDVPGLFGSASRLLADDGTLFVSTMNRTLQSYLLTIVGAEYVMGYLPRGTHDFARYQSPDEVARHMADVGLEPLDVSGMVLRRPPLLGIWDWRLDPTNTNVNWIGAYRHASTK